MSVSCCSERNWISDPFGNRHCRMEMFGTAPKMGNSFMLSPHKPPPTVIIGISRRKMAAS